jgi:uncharacterized membrane protein
MGISSFLDSQAVVKCNLRFIFYRNKTAMVGHLCCHCMSVCTAPPPRGGGGGGGVGGGGGGGGGGGRGGDR